MKLNSFDLISKDKKNMDIDQEEPFSNEEEEENGELKFSKNVKYKYNCHYLFLLTSFLFCCSCFCDLFVTLIMGKKKSILLYILRIVTDSLCIFPIFCYLGLVNYKCSSAKNICILILINIPQMAMNICTLVLLFIGKKIENNGIWLIISTISNCALFVFLCILTIIKLIKEN